MDIYPQHTNIAQGKGNAYIADVGKEGYRPTDLGQLSDAIGRFHPLG